MQTHAIKIHCVVDLAADSVHKIRQTHRGTHESEKPVCLHEGRILNIEKISSNVTWISVG